MNATKLLGIAMAAALMSTGAMAATMTPAQQCTALQKQFDQEIVKHGTAAKAGEAKTLRTDAGKLHLRQGRRWRQEARTGAQRHRREAAVVTGPFGEAGAVKPPTPARRSGLTT